MKPLYRTIGNVSLSSFPTTPQTILKIWEGQSGLLNPQWLEGVCQISRWVRELKIRTAHLSFDPEKGTHVDGVPGVNFIWIHRGHGFYIEDCPVVTNPGDVILFDRRFRHSVRAQKEYVRTVITTIAPHQEARYPRFLQNGVFYDGFRPL